VSAVPGSLVTASILSELHETGAFPPQWQGATAYDGGVSTMDRNGDCRVTWMGEVSLGRFEVVEQQRFRAEPASIAAYAKRLYGDEIDGVAIDWSK